MRSPTICRQFLSASVTALLVACGGSQTPMGAPSAAMAMHAGRGESWMLPEAKSEDLLYVSDAANHDVEVFDYRSGKQVGEVGLFEEPAGECTDTGGNVYITDVGDAFVTEYAHGGAQVIGNFDDPFSDPISCSVDPISGDLAAANITGNGKESTGAGSLAIWHNHGLYPDFFVDSKIEAMHGCSYDDEGNIFVDGVNSSGGFQYAEFTKGSYDFTNISPNQSISDPNTLQWDGTYVAVGGFANMKPIIYRIDGAGGHVVSTTTLRGTSQSPLTQFWIQGRRVVGVYGDAQSKVSYWRYQAGRRPFKTIGNLAWALGVTVSLAQGVK